MNGNFFQLKGTFGGFFPNLTAGAAPNTFSFDLRGFPAKLGNDWIYADRIRFRVSGPIHRTTDPAEGGDNTFLPNRQQLANLVRQVRLYSPILGEVAPRAMTYGTFLTNHDSWFDRRFAPHSREQFRQPSALAATLITAYADFEINFQRDYLESPDDTCPLLCLLEGGILEVDLAPTTALPVGPDQVSWTLGNADNAWTCNATVDYHHDSQLVIHTPAQRRLYQRQLAAPAFELQNVGSPQGLDGVASGCRLAVMSWLGKGYEVEGLADVDPTQFYVNAPAATSGVNFGDQGLQRMDVPWRDQRSITDVNAWLHSFLTDARPVTTRQQWDALFAALATFGMSDQSGFPNQEDTDPAVTPGDPLINELLTFLPMVWPGKDGSKIADMQMVDGTLSYNADFVTQPSTLTHRYRTDEICQFDERKVREIMMLLKCPHKEDGGEYVLVPKYHGARLGSNKTAAFLPQKIVHQSAV